MSSSDLFGYNTNDGDGCSLTWDIESGWTWSGDSQTSKDTCLEIWGDDKNTTPNDGCSSDCKTENRYNWAPVSPDTFSTWTAICEDGLVVGSEQWDDKNTTPNDGCSLDCKTDTTETGMKEDGRVIVIMDREHTI